MLMRFLKTLMICFCFLLVSPQAFAQSEAVAPTFSIGYSIGVPESLHLAVRNMVGVSGLGVRADIGGVYIFFAAYIQLALNLEYHFAEPRGIGFYFGAGVVAFELLWGGEFLTGNEYKWKLGGQAYIGLDLGPLFLEIGMVQLLDYGAGGLQPRIAAGFNIYF